jgi:hypothetical protein
MSVRSPVDGRGVEPRDAGAASRLVNVSHQLGGSLGLGILVAAFAAEANRLLIAFMTLTHCIWWCGCLQ